MISVFIAKGNLTHTYIQWNFLNIEVLVVPTTYFLLPSLSLSDGITAVLQVDKKRLRQNILSQPLHLCFINLCFDLIFLELFLAQ